MHKINETERSDSVAKDKINVSNQSKHSVTLLVEQIRLLYLQASKALVASLLVSSACVAVFWDQLSQPILIGWFFAVAILSIARSMLVISYNRKKPSDVESIRWGNYFIVGVSLSAFLWGFAGGAFFISDSLPHQLFLAYILGGMIAGGMATLSSYPGAFLLFALPTIVPYTYQIFSYSGDNQIAIGATFLLFSFLMWRISRQLHQTITHSFKLRFENSDLIKDLQQSQAIQNAINRELQAQISERDATQRALQTSKLELERRIIERTEELALSNDRLYREKELFRVTLASIADAVITTDAMDKITYLNPIAEIYTGWNSNDANGTPVQETFQIRDIVNNATIDNPMDINLTLNHDQSKKNRECILTRKDKQEFIIDYSAAPIRNHQNQMMGSVLIFRDVTEQRKLTDKLTYQATHDSLTGLLNRNEFEKRLNKILKSLRKNDIHALLFLDLDQFKSINDTCGHSAGDDLLRQITALLNSKLRTRDTLARLGGDEFGVILEHCPEEEALQVASTLRELVQNFRYQWHDKIFSVGLSIGLYPIKDAHQKLEDVMKAADSACITAKNQGRNQVQIYREENSSLIDNEDEVYWLPRIQNALANRRLCLYFQPIIAISHSSNLVEHGEIFVRLYGERNQLILPNIFLPLAERYHQMIEIDRWVIKESLKAIKTRVQKKSTGRYVINLSAHTVCDENFLDFVVHNLKKQTVHPTNICFELTEKIALSDLQQVTAFVVAVKNLGCHFSIGNFGTNLSSFGYLKNIPIDYLKIDGQLIRNIRSEAVDRAMVESINHVAHHMKLETIAEWVEDIQALQLLEEIGIDFVQGFGLAKPYLFTSEMSSNQRTIH